MVCILATVVILLMAMFDVFYYLRAVLTIAFGRIFQRRFKVTETTTIYGFCSTQDLGLALDHMNNARFARELDFARFHFYDRIGLHGEMIKRKTYALQAATNIRYRRMIPTFTFYKIETKILYWEDRSVYLEHKFITNDGFIRAIVLGKGTMNASVDEVMEILQAGPRPKLTPDLDIWIKCLETSSKLLKSSSKHS